MLRNMTSDRIGLSAAGRKLLSSLKVPREVSELEAIGVSGEVLGALQTHGLIERQDNTRPPLDLYDAFNGWKSQRGMLVDHARTTAFQRAIEAVVRPGDRVIDVGTGSGVLAMIAARAGAAEVVGLEVTDMARWADRIARANGLDAVRIVQGDAGGYEAADPADLVMGEFIGMSFLEEWRHYAAFVQVRDRNLKPSGTVIPRAARLLLSAVDSRKLYYERGYGFWEAPAYGIDFSEVRESEIHSPQRYIVSADHSAIVCTREIATFDFLSGSERDYFFTSTVEFIYPAAGSFHGFIGHFELDLMPGLVLGTGPATRETHWHQSYFPMPAVQVPAGGRIAAGIRTFLSADDDRMCLGLTLTGTCAGKVGECQEAVFVLE